LVFDLDGNGRRWRIPLTVISASAAFMKGDLRRIVGFCEVVMPSYAIDEFRLHFRMTKTTFEVLAQELAACMH